MTAAAHPNLVARSSATAPVQDFAPRERHEHAKTDSKVSSQVARLTRELQALEMSLAAAERIAISSRSGPPPQYRQSDFDIGGRRAELDRRELNLQQRERSVDQQRRILEQAHEKLSRAKESLKRAIRRFQSQAAQQTVILNDREQRLDSARAQLNEARREFGRDQLRLKLSLRSLP